MVQLAGQHPDGQRQVPAQPGDLCGRPRPGAQIGAPGQPAQQRRGLTRRQGVQADRRGVRQRGQVPAAGDQHHAAGQQRGDLLMGGRVIEQQQHLLPGQEVPPPSGPGRQAGRDLLRPGPGGQQQAGQRVGRVDRPLTRRVGVQRQEELPVRELFGQPVRRVDRKRRLADPGHPADRVDPHHTPAGRCGRHRAGQLRELGRPAGEAGDVAGQRPGRRRRGRAFADSQHLARRDPAARCGLEQRPLRPGQAQRPGQQPGRIVAGRAVHAPLQVADRPRGQARRLRQLLLGQPGIIPQLPQQPGKAQRRLPRHRPIAPHTPCPPLTGDARPRHGQDPANKPNNRAGRPASARQQVTGQPSAAKPGRHTILWVSCGRHVW